MDKKVIGIIIALIAIIAIVVVCVNLGGGKKEEKGDAPVVVINDSGEKVISVPVNAETDPYKANIPDEIIEFYMEKVQDIENKHKAEQAELLEENPDLDLTSLTKLKYDLVFFDDNNTPEMVVTNTGYNTRLYTYDAGKVIYAMQDPEDPSGEEYGWAFGAGGNMGYEYIPRANVLRNINNDMAGLIRYYTFYTLDDKTFQLTNLFGGSLGEYHVVDTNDNGNIDDDEMEYVEVPTAYTFKDQAITEKEAKSYVVVSEDFEELCGTKLAEDFLKTLQGMTNTK